MSSIQGTFDAARRNDEFGAVPYRVAMLKGPKEDRICVCTPVLWDDAPQSPTRIEFRSIGKRLVTTPPTLPRGYKMRWHPSWGEIFSELTSKAKEPGLSFEVIDDVVRDINDLEEAIGEFLELSEIYDARPDYLAWSTSFEDAWGEMESTITDLLARLVPPPWEKYRDLSYRTMPPTPREALFQMIEMLDKGEAERE